MPTCLHICTHTYRERERERGRERGRERERDRDREGERERERDRERGGGNSRGCTSAVRGEIPLTTALTKERGGEGGEGEGVEMCIHLYTCFCSVCLSASRALSHSLSLSHTTSRGFCKLPVR